MCGFIVNETIISQFQLSNLYNDYFTPTLNIPYFRHPYD